MRANLTANEVLERAKTAAATTRRSFALFVTTATEWAWHELASAEQQAQR